MWTCESYATSTQTRQQESCGEGLVATESCRQLDGNQTSWALIKWLVIWMPLYLNVRHKMNTGFRSRHKLRWMFFVSLFASHNLNHCFQAQVILIRFWLTLHADSSARLTGFSSFFSVLFPRWTDTPRLLNTSSAQSVMTGSPATLYCNYEGNPKPSIKWFYINPRTAETSHVPNEARDQSVLHIENTTYSHEGMGIFQWLTGQTISDRKTVLS